MKSEKMPFKESRIKPTLAKNPSKYSEHSLQRIVGDELNAKQGDVIKYYKTYYKTYTIGGGSAAPNLISQQKYLEMLRTSVKDSLRVMGYDYMQDIVGSRKLPDNIH